MINVHPAFGEGLPEACHEIATDTGPGPKERITLWVGKRTVKFFRATGKGWQTRMNLLLVDKSAERHEVDGPPPGWGQTKAEEDALEAALTAHDAAWAARPTRSQMRREGRGKGLPPEWMAMLGKGG